MAKTKLDRKKRKKKKKAQNQVIILKKRKFLSAYLEHYRSKVIPEMQKKFSYKNIMQVPKLQKICLNVGVGAAAVDPKLIDATVKDFELIAGQKPTVVKAKKSVSNFKLREGMNIAVRVTLRNDRMFEFLDRFVNVAIPRIRDFRGISDKSFDGRGNYSMGVKEQIIFPEINVDGVTKITGMDVTFVTTAKTDEEGV